jgi:SNF2 family DNA or RNA helicase
MGLGKTVQTISLLSHLASDRGCWGPHLIIAPSSCIVNWECEIKRFCPGLKVISYFGSSKHRKNLRTGWSKPNFFNICVTSYQLVVQDFTSFRRKKWYYMILDEAHNIKNFKSKRWQTLLRLSSVRRLMLTGTPIQNNLLELWSLMHFLMPSIFSSRREFSYWFNNPLISSFEDNRSVSPELVAKLHDIIRPFILRRLKKDVEQQLPGKYEHLVFCKLSKRQAYLYEEVMTNSTVKSHLQSGNYLGMMNALMQLRKVCNHPDLVEPRPILTPVFFKCLHYQVPSVVHTRRALSPWTNVSSFLTRIWMDDFASNYYLVGFHPQLLEYDSGRGDFNEELSEICRAYHIEDFLSDLRLQKATSQTKLLRISGRKIPMGKVGILFSLWNILCSQSLSPIYSYVVSAFLKQLELFNIFVFVVPTVLSTPVQLQRTNYCPISEYFAISRQCFPDYGVVSSALSSLHYFKSRQSLYYPNKALVQFDSGKLRTLSVLLRTLKKDNHRCLIFTQMTRMLDILEMFLNLNHHSFVRLDGSTSIEDRQRYLFPASIISSNFFSYLG